MAIKLIIFDFDGVLAPLKDIHFNALNQALGEFGYPPLTLEEHLDRFDGLSTRKKLDKFPPTYHITSFLKEDIASRKQEITLELLRKELKTDHRLQDLLESLQVKGYNLAVASN